MSVLSIIAAVQPLIEKALGFIPNSQERDKARAELEMSLIKIDAEQRLAQVELNKVEANHASIFIAGWRPFIGWVAGLAILWKYLMGPLLVWSLSAFGIITELPVIANEELMTLVFAMLGVGGMRSFDKLKGTDTKGVATN